MALVTPVLEKQDAKRKGGVREYLGTGVLAIIPNISMANGKNTLRGIACFESWDVSRLKPGQFIMFINPKCSALKLYGHNNWVNQWWGDGNWSLLTPDGLATMTTPWTGKLMDVEARALAWALKYYAMKIKEEHGADEEDLH